MLEYAALIPVLPFLAAAAIQLFEKRLGRRASHLAICAMLLSFLLSLAALTQVIGYSMHHEARGPLLDLRFRWLTVHSTDIFLGIAVDNLAAVMLVVVSLVALLVDIYSLGYMRDDPRFGRFYRYMSLFGFSMLGLVLSDNLLQLFIFWELVGLCSYLLIGFWSERDAPQYAQKKAFLVTKFGDLGLLLGVLAVFFVFGTFHFESIFLKIPGIAPGIITLIALLVFMGAMGKSAQFPLHIWLPNAMEGPTPVSALIHAATMVAAGVYLVARMYPLFAASPAAMLVVAVIGTITLFMAATIALTVFDIKAVLAYSTISQLGYMMLGLGAGSLTAGIFHLMTHAFFKALLFLGAGSVIHAVHSQDLRQMGGLRKRMPLTFWCMLIAALAISGVPPFSGFWSKDEVLLAAFHYNTALFAVALAGALLTGLYMFRLVFLCFFGSPKGSGQQHESPASMAGPMVVLAALSALAGLVATPLAADWFQSFISFGSGHHAPSVVLMLLSVAAAGCGITLAYLAYIRKTVSAERLGASLGPLYGLVRNKYYIDEIVDFVFVKGSLFLSWLLSLFDSQVVDRMVDLSAVLARQVSRLSMLFDTAVVDGLVELSARLARLASAASRWIDNTIVDGLVNLSGWLTQSFGRALRQTQTGQAQTYVAMIFVGIVAAFLLVYSMVT